MNLYSNVFICTYKCNNEREIFSSSVYILLQISSDSAQGRRGFRPTFEKWS